MSKKYWQRKFHFKYTLPDGNIYYGFINTEADREEDLYNIDDIKGWFWVRKAIEGWYGGFHLAPGLIADQRCEGTKFQQWVVTKGVRRPQRKFHKITSREDAEEIMNYLENVHYDAIPHFCGRLEDCITSEETHYW